MAFFSRKNVTETLEIECPVCLAKQNEPSLVISTICRGCTTHLRITDGVAAAPHHTSMNHFVPAPLKDEPLADTETSPPSPDPALTSAPQSDQSEPEPARSTSHNTVNTDSTENANDADDTDVTDDTDDTDDADDADNTVNTDSTENEDDAPRYMKDPPDFLLKKEAETPSEGLNLFSRKPASRERVIACFECFESHQISSRSTSSLCPKCGAYISLKDFQINEMWNRRIQTRGDVTVQKKGNVKGTTIHCHHLVIEGTFTGGADCSGNFTIRNHAKIMGRVTCQKLIIEKRAQIDFLNTVEAEEVIIDGTVQGNIQCRGKLTLQKRATLTGDIAVGTLSIQEGAKHHGQISMNHS